MSVFPNQIDDDVTLPRVDDNVTEIRGDIINALRSAIFNIQSEIGIGASGLPGSSISSRLGVSLEADGRIKSSAIASMGLVTLPITNREISQTAQIQESKLLLDYKTADLYNYITEASKDIVKALNFINGDGLKIGPHISGAGYNHTLSHIKIDGPSINTFKKFSYSSGTSSLLRPDDNAINLIKDLNKDLVQHQMLAGPSPLGDAREDGYYSHIASSIKIKTDKFSYIDKNAKDVQSLADFIDENNLLLFGTRTQTLFKNGIPRSSRSFEINSSILSHYNKYNASNDGYVSALLGEINSSGGIDGKINGGQLIVPPTAVKTYLNSDQPKDIIDSGDDIVEFKVTPSSASDRSFDSIFNKINPGDIVTINYKNSDVNNSVVSSFIIKEVHAIPDLLDASGSKYFLRLNGKNLFNSTIAIAVVNRSFQNTNKYGVLALASTPSFDSSSNPSLIIGNPRGAQVLGLNFNPNVFGPDNYNLYLTLYSNGNPDDSSFVSELPAIDVTGNKGQTPGLYTLDSIVESTNYAFRKRGYNYRFIAFSYNGEFGIMLADPYRGSAFSITSGAIENGEYDTSLSNIRYPKNVINVFDNIDPLGFGPGKANVASPSYYANTSNLNESKKYTKIFYPLTRNNYYINGVEKERLSASIDRLNIDQYADENGDGYWLATISDRQSIPTNGRVLVSYTIDKLINKAELKAGKTIVVQPHGKTGMPQDFGRFYIEDVDFEDSKTVITVFDAVHGVGVSPFSTSQKNTKVRIYYANDSISFNYQNRFDDLASNINYKRSFEIYMSENGSSFSHERARFINTNLPSAITSSLKSDQELFGINIVKVSKKISGYYSNNINKITLAISSLDKATGIYDGYLCNWNGVKLTNFGPASSGKIGEVTRFHDETCVDYIDFSFNPKDVASISNISPPNTKIIDIQLFPTLSNDSSLMLLGTVQLDTSNKTLSYLRDERGFGNVGENELADSAINFIQSADRLLHENGTINGFNISGSQSNKIFINGGTAIVNGKVVYANPSEINIPRIKEKFQSNDYNISWYVCVDINGHFVTIPSTNYDSYSGTPNNENRSVNIGSTNYLYGNTFKGLVKNRKDLNVLYLVSSKIDGEPASGAFSMEVKDLRKYVHNQDSLHKIVVSDSPGNGNFRTIESAISFIKLINNEQSVVDIKSPITLSTDPSLSNLNLIFNGLGSTAPLTINSSITVSSSDYSKKIIFNNFSISFSKKCSIKNVEFNNCLITFHDSSSEKFTFENVRFIDSTLNFKCKFDLINSTIDRCYFSIDSGVTGNFDRSSINNSTSIDLLGTINIVSDTKVLDSSISSSRKNCIVLGNNSLIERCSFYYKATGAVPSNLIESGSAMLSRSTSGYLGNVSINKNLFKNAIGYEHLYPFIELTVTESTALLDNIKICDNKFIDENNPINSISSVTFRPVIHIRSYEPSGSTGKSSKIINSNIDRNYCNSFQMIAITAFQTMPVGFFPFPISTHNLSISGNTCGTIGFNTACSNSAEPNSPYTDGYGSSNNSMIISNNNVNIITNIDNIGRPVKLVASSSPTGSVSIVNNSVNWISACTVGSSNFSEPIHISNNKISPANPEILNNFKYEDGSVLKNAAIFLYSRSNTPQRSSSLISGNTIYGKKSISSTTGASFDYYYTNAIYCDAHCNISNNSIFKCVNSDSNSIILFGSNVNVNVFGNNIKRADLDIKSYIEGPGVSPVGTATIIDNVFDSEFTDSGNTQDESIKNIPKNWTVERNKNQTSYLSLPLYKIFNSFYDKSFEISGKKSSLIKLSTTGSTVSYNYISSINSFLPKFAKIKSIICGIELNNLSGSASDVNNNSFKITASKEPFTSFDITNPGSSIVDTAARGTFMATRVDASDYKAFSSTNVNDFKNNGCQYFKVNPTDFINDNVTLLFLQADITISTKSTCTIDVLLSPVVIKYLW